MRMRVLSYNIHRAIGVDRRFRPDRIIRVLEHHEADIVLLQEVDEGAPRSRELDLAKEIALAVGYPYFAVGHNVRMRRGRYGNATLSRFPIGRERNIDLTIGRRKRRGCQHTTLEYKPGRMLEVFNLHLGLSARERERQVGKLIHSPEFRRIDPDVPTMVGGDFNDWRTLLRPIFTEVLGFTCSTDRASDRQPIRTYPSFSPTGGLDKLYVRGFKTLAARSCRLNVSKVASDHRPIIIDLQLT